MRQHHLAISFILIATCAVAQSRPATQAADPVQQAIEQLHAAGAPATFSDLKPASLPPESNAATDIDRAVELIDRKKDSPSSSSMEYGDDLPYPPQWFAMAKGSEQANARALAALHAARQKKAIAWQGPEAPFREWVQSGLKSLATYRHLANITADHALYLHFAGQEQDSIEAVRDLEFLAWAISQKPFLVSKLVGIGIWTKSSFALQTICAGLDLPADQREAAKVLLAELLDERPIHELIAQAIREERTTLIEELQHGTLKNTPGLRAMLPESIAAYEEMIAAVNLPPWHQIKDPPPNLLTTVIPALKRIPRTHWRLLMSRRMAATGVAVSFYRTDHKAYPVNLEALVPQYLPAVPQDPFARDGAVLRYVLLEEGKRPQIGSVGEDGKPGAPGLSPAAQYSYNRVEGDSDDIWTDLAAWQP